MMAEKIRKKRTLQFQITLAMGILLVIVCAVLTVNSIYSASRNYGELVQMIEGIPTQSMAVDPDTYSVDTVTFADAMRNFSVQGLAVMAGVGTVIAHEITHAFDNKGARFHKNGLESDWWTPEDYAKFQDKCNAVAAFYDGWESAPGIAISGTQTLGENIAHIGAMSCALEVLKKTENPDYDKFFKAYAKAWLKCTSRERMAGLQEADERVTIW